MYDQMEDWELEEWEQPEGFWMEQAVFQLAEEMWHQHIADAVERR